MSKIQVIRGSYDSTCTVERNLTENQVKKPVIRDIIEAAEPRMLSTLIVSGQMKDGVGHVKTKIGTIPKSKTIGSSGYRYKILGRIQKHSVINAQVGTTSAADNTFQLSMKDNYLYPGMVVTFHGNQFQARVMGAPTGSTNNFVYTFQSVEADTFDYAVHVAPQSGAKTCFGSYTSYGEKSLRGYSRAHYPDEFINHMTIQRKSVAISGDALTDVLWVQYNGTKGWMYHKESQARQQFLMEDEHNKWFGKSSMKNADGSLRDRSSLVDHETGEEIVMGDGLISQIEGGNEVFGSGADGEATLDDIRDLMTIMEKKSDMVTGKSWYCVTGTDGWNTIQKLLENRASQLHHLTTNVNSSKKVGGPDVEVGYNFFVYNVNGNQVTFTKHPMFDDESRFTERGADGKTLQSSMMVFLDMSTYEGKANIEILSKGEYGINRSMVSGYLEGLTGRKGTLVSTVDACQYEMLKQDGIFCYNTNSCGIIRKSIA